MMKDINAENVALRRCRISRIRGKSILAVPGWFQEPVPQEPICTGPIWVSPENYYRRPER